MYVRRRIDFLHTLADSWPEAIINISWTLLVITLFAVWNVHMLIVPVLPVTLVGIAVSLYLSFKTTSAYNRWWEARREFGAIASLGRTWVNHIDSFIFHGSDTVPGAIRRELIERYIGIVHAAAYQLRSTSRLPVGGHWSLFRKRRPVSPSAVLLADAQVYRRFLTEEEYTASRAFSNPAAYLLRRQGERLRELVQEGWLDSVRQAAMMQLLGTVEASLARCERIKNTPFPRQIAYFAAVFTWILAILLPLALLEVFEHEATEHAMTAAGIHHYVYTMLPFSLVISFSFLTMERISRSIEDAFEGGVHDVPVSTLARSAEIDLRQALGDTEIPPPLEPIDHVLY